MAINDSNKTDQFDNEQAQLVHNDIAYQGATETTQLNQNTLIGSVTEAAPSTDIASSGLNGRLQRIAQRISSLILQIPATLGQKLMSGSMSVTVASDQSTLPISGTVTANVVPFEKATFSVVTTNTIIGNNKSMLAIQNTGTSRVTIREVWIINDRTSAITGIAGDFSFIRINSFSGGTALNASLFDTNDTLPSGITIATNAIVSGEAADPLRFGTWSTDEWGPGTLDQEGLDHALQQLTPFWQQTTSGKGVVLRQNQGAHIKFATNSTAGFFNIRIVFTTE